MYWLLEFEYAAGVTLDDGSLANSLVTEHNYLQFGGFVPW